MLFFFTLSTGFLSNLNLYAFIFFLIYFFFINYEINIYKKVLFSLLYLVLYQTYVYYLLFNLNKVFILIAIEIYSTILFTYLLHSGLYSKMYINKYFLFFIFYFLINFICTFLLIAELIFSLDKSGTYIHSIVSYIIILFSNYNLFIVCVFFKLSSGLFILFKLDLYKKLPFNVIFVYTNMSMWILGYFLLLDLLFIHEITNYAFQTFKYLIFIASIFSFLAMSNINSIGSFLVISTIVTSNIIILLV